MTDSYVPRRGDVIWLEFDPQAGHEEAGRRPALTISPVEYNRKVSLGLFCPVTSKIKGYPFEVLLPAGLPVSGAILADQIKNLDWQARNAQKICNVSNETLAEVIEKGSLLLEG